MSDDSLWADIVAVAKEYGIDLSKPNERKEKREPKPVWRPTGGIPYGLCGECGYWEAEKGRTKIEGKWLSVHLGRCEIDKLRHDRCQSGVRQRAGRGAADGDHGFPGHTSGGPGRQEDSRQMQVEVRV